MLLSEIASLMNIGLANQLEPEDALVFMDAVQKAAYERELDAFLIYDQRVTLQLELTLSAGGYVGATAADIGGTVTGGTSGAQATLNAYDNDTRVWRVTPVAGTGDFVAGEALSASVTGAGAYATESVWKGPYEAPANCRKIWGITRRTPGRFNYRPERDYGDYGVPADTGRPFEGGQPNDLEKTFLFAVPPAKAAVLYWVYWRLPPDITSFDDQSVLTIPAAYHIQFMACCKAAASAATTGEIFTDDVVQKHLGGWFAALAAPYRNQVGYQNGTLDVDNLL